MKEKMTLLLIEHSFTKWLEFGISLWRYLKDVLNGALKVTEMNG